MGGKELVKMLVETGNGRNSRVIPWWKEYLEDEDQEDENQDYYNDINDGDDDEDEDQGNSRKRYYTEEEIAGVEECAAALGKEGLSAPVGEGGYTLFHLLVRHNFYRAVEKALEDGVDVNLTDGEGRLVTPLHVACCFANLAMVKLLLGQGADASLCDAHGRNAFQMWKAFALTRIMGRPWIRGGRWRSCCLEMWIRRTRMACPRWCI